MNWDEDIAGLKLSDTEKDGLQVFRNYSKAVDNHRIAEFIRELDATTIDIEPFKQLNHLVLTEDVRMITVIVCAFFDDQLREMYKRELPKGIPGGAGELLNGFGPLSRLGQRIQVAYALGWIGTDLLSEAHKLRGLRNAISHNWDSIEVQSRMDEFIANTMTPLEDILAEAAGDDSYRLNATALSKADLFRLRLVWLISRFFYECNAGAKAVKARISPTQALYVNRPHPKLLHELMAVTSRSTAELASRRSTVTSQ
jgi:hypothetical protein